MPRPTVSVVLPTYNRAATLERSIRSVLGQSFRDLELLVVDGHSTDGTWGLLDRLAAEDPRVRPLHCNRRGAAAARNEGVRKACGTLVAFQDSDDEWLEGNLQAKVGALAGWPEAVACYSFIGRVRDGVERTLPDPASPTLEGRLDKALLRRNLASTQALVVRSEALAAVGPFDESLPQLEDWDLGLRLSLLGPFAFVPRVLVRAPYQPDSLSLDRLGYLSALEAIVAKHRRRFESMPRVLGFHADRLGLGHLQEGRGRQGRAWSRRAWRLDKRRLSAGLRSILPLRVARRLQRVPEP